MNLLLKDLMTLQHSESTISAVTQADIDTDFIYVDLLPKMQIVCGFTLQISRLFKQLNLL